MRIAAVILCACLIQSSGLVEAQTPAISSDPQAVLLVNEANGALTGGTQISDIALNASATWIAGSTNTTGNATLKAKGATDARVDISGPTVRTELRNDSNGMPDGEWMGADGVPHHMSQHNCRTPGAWFSPVLILAWVNQGDAVLTYIGSEMRDGIPMDHIRAFRRIAGQSPEATAMIQRLTTVDLLLASASHLPAGLLFNTHADNDVGRDIPIEIRFSDYRSINGVLVPFRIQRLLQNRLNLDLIVTTASPNAGLSDSDFALH